MDIFESLESLNISEECFSDILNIVEEVISEYLTVGKVKGAINNSLKDRVQQYKSASDPVTKKRAGERLDRAVKIKNLLSSGFKDTRKVTPKVRDSIKQATTTLSPEEEAKAEESRRQKELESMWQTQPSHKSNMHGYDSSYNPYNNGYRYLPKIHSLY